MTAGAGAGARARAAPPGRAEQGRPRSCDVESVVSGHAGAGAVRRLVLRGVAPGQLPAGVQECLPRATSGSSQLIKTHLKPGRRLTAYYRLTVAGDPAGSRCAAVTWSMGDGATSRAEPLAAGRSEAELEEEASRRGLRGPFTRLTGTDPHGQHGRVTISPLDADFPQLVRLSDRRHLGQALSAAGLPAGHTQVAALRYRPGQRHVLRLATVDGHGAPLYAKLHRTGHRPGEEPLAAVAAHLRAADPPVDLVLPAAELAGDLTSVWRAAPGRSLAALVLGGDLASVSAAGAALRALHEVPVSACDLPAYDLCRELRTVRSASTHLASLCPDVGARAAAVLAAVDERIGGLTGEAATFLHGDVKAEHVLLSRRVTSWLDLDRCSLGDPALDLGKLLADLRWTLDADHPLRVAPAQDALLDGYGGRTGERRARARVLESLFLVRFAARRVGLHERGWRLRVHALVTAAERLLDAADRRVR